MFKVKKLIQIFMNDELYKSILGCEMNTLKTVLCTYFALYMYTLKYALNFLK